MDIQKSLSAACAVLLLAAATPGVPAAAAAPATWDNLVQVNSKRFKLVYLLPGADFRPYKKVMLDPPETAFEKNFIRDYNSSGRGVSRRISDAEAQKALADVQAGFAKILSKAYADAGYPVVSQPGPDVLRLRTAVINLYVNAPERPTAGRSRTYAPEAGRATVVIEARDSVTNALLGRAIDGKVIGDMGGMMQYRSSVGNRADFERQFKTWATDSIKGLEALKAAGPAAAG
jgi:hypothetical protein